MKMSQAAIQRRVYRAPSQQVPVNLPSAGVSNVQGLGFLVLLAFVFMIFSRVFDMYLSNLHIPGISDRIMAAVVIISGAFWRPFQTAIGKRLLWFTGWMLLGIPFSVWRSDSVYLVTHQWWASVLVFAAVGGLIVDYRQYCTSIIVLSLALFTLALFCFHFGTIETGRLAMSNRSRFANPNEMAQAMLMGIPFWMAIFKRSEGLGRRVVSGIVVMAMLYIIAKTGSRGALISIGILYLVLLYHATIVGRAGLLLGGSLLMCSALAFLPTSLKDRYRTLFSEEKFEVQDVNESGLLISANTSTESREHLFHQSLILTAKHPIFGVGVGEFTVAENALSISQGRAKGSWLGTHNTYMQVASETGPLGAIFFIAVLIKSLKTASSIFVSTRGKPQLRHISTQAEALFLSLVCLATTDIFIHAAYTMLLPFLAGMATSLEYTARPIIAKVSGPMPAA